MTKTTTPATKSCKHTSQRVRHCAARGPSQHLRHTYDIYETDSAVYLVMEYVEAGTFLELLARSSASG